MTEIEINARAQMYLEKLANGINPLTDEEVAENDVVNNVRISRCLFYSSGILKQKQSVKSFHWLVEQTSKNCTNRKEH